MILTVYNILLPHNISARELQIQDDIVTFHALLCKSIFRFIDRCRKSNNLLTVNREYFRHCNQLLCLVQMVRFLKVTTKKCPSLSCEV